MDSDSSVTPFLDCDIAIVVGAVEWKSVLDLFRSLLVVELCGNSAAGQLSR